MSNGPSTLDGLDKIREREGERFLFIFCQPQGRSTPIGSGIDPRRRTQSPAKSAQKVKSVRIILTVRTYWSVKAILTLYFLLTTWVVWIVSNLGTWYVYPCTKPRGDGTGGTRIVQSEPMPN